MGASAETNPAGTRQRRQSEAGAEALRAQKPTASPTQDDSASNAEGGAVKEAGHSGLEGSWTTGRMKFFSWKVILAVAIYACASIILTRFRYRKGLADEILQFKEGILQNQTMAALDTCFVTNSSDECDSICLAAEQASQVRFQFMQNMRQEYKFAGVAAELFDVARDSPAESRLETLKAKKSCLQILQSVDHSNTTVDKICAVLLLIGYTMAVSTIGMKACTKVFDILLAMIALDQEPLYPLIAAIFSILEPDLARKVFALYDGACSYLDSDACRGIVQVGTILLGAAFMIAPTSQICMGFSIAWWLLQVISVCGACELADLVLPPINGDRQSQGSVKSD